MLNRLKAIWTVITAREFVLCHRDGTTLNPRGQASTFSVILVSLCRAYNEAPDAIKPELKKLGMLSFMPLKEATRHSQEMLGDLLKASLSDTAKTEELKKSVRKPAKKK